MYRQRADPSGATWIRCQGDPSCRDPILRPGGGTAQPVQQAQLDWRGRVRTDGVR